MPTDRKFTGDESSRRGGYEHTAPKDSNFNPLSMPLGRAMRADARNSAEKPGRKSLAEYQGKAAQDISDAVPRKGE